MTVSGNDLLWDVSGNDVKGGIGYELLYSAVYDAAVDALAASQTVTDGQAVTSSALNYFQGVLGNQMLPVDYVVYVGEPYYYWSGGTQRLAYEYCMAYGDLEVSGTHFTGTGTVLRMRTSGDVSVISQEGQTVSLYAPMYYSRSNLGGYSGIYQYDYTGLATLFSLVLGGVVWFVKKLMRVKY